MATVVAATDCILLEVTRELLQELAPLPQVAQQYAKERLLANLLRSNDLFKAFSSGELARLVERFELRHAQRGDALVKQGEVGRGLFDPKYMNALYEYGLTQGRSETRFRKGPPAATPASPTASTGASGDTVPK